MDGIFGNKNVDLQYKANEKKYLCDNGICKETTKTTGVSLDKCMSTCFGVTNLFNNLNLNSGTYNTNNVTTTTKGLNFTSSSFNFSTTNTGVVSNTATRYKCDMTQQRCVADSKGEWTDLNKCNSNCKFDFVTSGFVNFDSLNLSSQSVTTTKTVRYKYNSSTGKCVEASSLDKNTYSGKAECEKANSYNSINSINLNSINNNFNLQFNP